MIGRDARARWTTSNSKWCLSTSGDGETELSYRYQPYSTYVRGVIVDGCRDVLLTGRDDSALIIAG